MLGDESVTNGATVARPMIRSKPVRRRGEYARRDAGAESAAELAQPGASGANADAAGLRSSPTRRRPDAPRVRGSRSRASRDRAVQGARPEAQAVGLLDGTTAPILRALERIEQRLENLAARPSSSSLLVGWAQISRACGKAPRTLADYRKHGFPATRWGRSIVSTVEAINSWLLSREIQRAEGQRWPYRGQPAKPTAARSRRSKP